MRILVTGGAGFIGSHVVNEFAAAGHDVLSVDALLPVAHKRMPEHLHPSVEYRWGDLADDNVSTNAVAGIDAVCHQAAMVGLGVDFGDVAAYVQHNDLATASLLRALHRDGFSGPIVLASSMVVYGEGSYRCPRHGQVRLEPRAEADLRAARWDPICPVCGTELTPEPVTEGSPTDPRNVYAATKLHQEQLCILYGREHATPVTMLRYHNVYGPGMPRDTPYAGVASIFRSAIEAGKPPLVFEDGQQLRDFIHVRDIARANRLALEAATHTNGVFNVASGQPRSVFDLAQALCRNTSRGWVEPLVVGGYRLGDVRHVFGATDAIRDRLGFQTEMSFTDGIEEFATAQLRPSAT